MKISKERFLFLLDIWAGYAMFFGAGYWFLSQIKRSIAIPVAWSLLAIGFLISVVLHARRRSRK
jgi:hypothetical protein